MEAYAYSTEREMMYRRKIDRVNVYMRKHAVEWVRREVHGQVATTSWQPFRSTVYQQNQ